MENLENQIANILDNSDLPFECKYYVLRVLTYKAKEVFENLKMQEQKQREYEEARLRKENEQKEEEEKDFSSDAE